MSNSLITYVKKLNESSFKSVKVKYESARMG